ncbi:ATP-dependent helicase [Paracidovorax avenae]|uniref:UvrD-helicase domain-containing protein n=1 Tax=Paracidovorax avenae TaxID=80867 RepID=UPI000D16FBC8|nr:ATP-dependent helicase [Paracidovorax avenae]AVS60758.1 ATP-dependent helicase [Paracidovorax avenae]
MAQPPSPAPLFLQRRPNDEQKAVLNTAAKTVLINALAGTGKTTTLATKAADLVQMRGARRVLMLAYSDAGLAALHDRLGRYMPADAREVRIMTVEQLCAGLLQAQGLPVNTLAEPLERQLLIRQAHAALLQELRHEAPPEAADFLARELDVQAFTDFEALAKQRLLHRDIAREGIHAAAYCRDHALDYGLYLLLGRYERLRRGPDDEPQFYAPGDCTYEIARQLGELDFGDPCPWLQGRYDAVLFDELQDLDEAAMLVLRHLVAGGNGVFVGAGDFNQHILPGAFSVFGNGLQRIRQELPEPPEVLTLNTTYRFGKAICEGLNPLFGVEFETHYPTKTARFERLAYDSDEDCARQLLAIHQRVQSAPPPANGAAPCLTVVLRSPEDSVLLEWRFAHEGIHYACKGLKRFYQRPEIALVLALFRALPGCGGQVRLTQGILSSALDGLMRYVRRGSRPDADVLANGLFDLQALAQQSTAEVDTRAVASELIHQPDRMRDFLLRASFDPNAPVASAACEAWLALPAEVCADAGRLCNHPLLHRFFAEAPISPQEHRQCLDSLLALSRICAGLSVDEFLGQLALMVESGIRQHRQNEAPSLQLLTVERCKGHEYEYVAVPLVERGRFPRAAALNEAYRERNMLYVALTRASRHLWLLEGSRRPVSPGPV